MGNSLMVALVEPAPIVRRPSLVNSPFQFGVPIEAAGLFWSYGIQHPRPQLDDSNRKIVMLIPGFMARGWRRNQKMHLQDSVERIAGRSCNG